jgi:hypothetical protein
VTVEAGSRFFRVSGDFLVDYEGTRLVRYLGNEKTVVIGRAFESISAGCFTYCRFLWSVTFEADSQVADLGESAFEEC